MGHVSCSEQVAAAFSRLATPAADKGSFLAATRRVVAGFTALRGSSPPPILDTALDQAPSHGFSCIQHCIIAFREIRCFTPEKIIICHSQSWTSDAQKKKNHPAEILPDASAWVSQQEADTPAELCHHHIASCTVLNLMLQCFSDAVRLIIVL